MPQMVGMKITSSTARMASASVLMFAFVSVAMCQTMAAQESEPASSDTPDEIVVYGKRSLFRLRRELYTAEENFFVAYNALNFNDEFDVNCDYVFRIEAHRRVRECKANFLKAYLGEFATGWLGQSPMPNLAALRRKEKLLREDMAIQISEHPELLEVFSDLASAKREYESERRDRRQER